MPRSAVPGQTLVYEDYARCIHCGLCLNACPTYRLWNLEADSPRGRIHQMIQVELNQQPITDSFVDHIDKCLDCRACETACPSGVEYGKLVEHARARIERDYSRSWLATVTFSQLNEATVRVLTANGCEVVVPKEQFCCGALAAHAGVRDAARDLTRKNLTAFLCEDFDAIITNSAGCGSTLKEYDHLFSPDEPEHAQARAFAGKTRDVTEFLAAFGLTAKMKPLPIRVTYQDSCHLLHGQKIREAPRALLHAIPNLDFVELPYSEICCGSAGIYNVTQTETSLELLAEKMHHVKSTGAQTTVTANPA